MSRKPKEKSFLHTQFEDNLLNLLSSLNEARHAMDEGDFGGLLDWLEDAEPYMTALKHKANMLEGQTEACRFEW